MTVRAAGRVPPYLSVTVVDAPRWRRDVRGLGRWLERAAPPRARGHVAIAVVDERSMRRLNGRFRGVDAPTDVLSFPSEPVSTPGSDGRASPKGGSGGAGRTGAKRPTSSVISHLGDIAIAGRLARRQAEAYGHPLATEFKLLALHGLLHLLGYDHERDQGQMEKLEARLRRRTNLPAGLLSRGSGRRPRR